MSKSTVISPNRVIDTKLIKKLTSKYSLKYKFDIRTELTSTNSILKAEAEKGAKSGSVLIAEHQTAGKGRLDRSFYSPDGTGIYMSILLRPSENNAVLSASDALMLTTASAVATARAIEKCCALNVGIKWVNDIYKDGKKVCGILTEGALKPNSAELDYAIIGIGINVFPPDNGFPAEISETASSLYTENEKKSAPKNIREHIISELLCEFSRLYTNHICREFDLENSFINEYIGRSVLDGKNIDIIKGERVLTGKALRVAEDCSLIVEYDDKTTEALTYGEVRIRLRREDRE